ncbi:DUF4350 domain-containing protein [Cryobacterium melibiosiphilum]|uniref:DUF4350 domain-containing protein n=1 Tax=Cryobacterium melibiosiphilum TaxID=995039 RepID=A0A3A5MPL2_9MICO|nr:DUF4350 domain-containing protein [Cryobacterium melibiosiphilum]RJT87444.1 DUF4350 domain-containing protein [Cryobacterium melibiosiphilum]
MTAPTVTSGSPVRLSTPASAPPPANAPATTPTLRAAGKRSLFWILAVVGGLLVAVLATVFAAGTGAGGRPLAADNAAPAGGRALAEVLRQQGVTVTVTDTLEETRAAASAAPDATLFTTDPDGLLTAERYGDLADIVPNTVLVDPDFLALQALAPGVGFGGESSSDELTATCALPAARAAQTLSPGGRTLGTGGLEIGDDLGSLPGAAGVTACFPSGDDRFSVVQLTSGSAEGDADDSAALTLVADATLFSNEKIATYGNAALALGLLGATDDVIWYLPTLGDVAVTGPPSLGELTPGWVTPVLVLLVLTTLTAALWRGRRFGALVPENLPVTVKGSETMEGRARLYSRSNARLRALDTLRIATVARLARQVGLARSATLDEVLVAVAASTGRPLDQVRSVLVGADPTTDRDLIALTDRLRELERATVHATAPGTTASTPASIPPKPASTGRMEP